MTKTGEEIHALWYVLTAIFVAIGGVSKAKAERKALEEIVKIYGENTLRKELEI
ncbi:MAG: hypothetical protein IJV37_05625 [Bacteroidales bacterium]|nr:hypothetical protein [Bacteroidales bacterium]